MRLNQGLLVRLTLVEVSSEVQCVRSESATLRLYFAFTGPERVGNDNELM
jgi:hypothetical protein